MGYKNNLTEEAQLVFDTMTEGIANEKAGVKKHVSMYFQHNDELFYEATDQISLQELDNLLGYLKGECLLDDIDYTNFE